MIDIPVLLIDDDPDLLKLLSIRLSSAGYYVTPATNAEAAMAQIESKLPALVITDVRLPGRDGLALFDEIRERYPTLPVILITAHGTIPDAVQATENGAFAYLTKPFDSRVLLDKVARAVRMGYFGQISGGATEHDDWHSRLIYRSQCMEKLLGEAKLVAETDAGILLRGASGTGKELLARAIHSVSKRSRQPFIAINCGAIPEQLLESELFGHVKGAFTGAMSNRIGLFQAAEGGTLLLDEIGDMPLSLQVKLLRVLQDREIRPLGANHGIAVDVRVMAATHCDLDLAMQEGEFREDLYYRLNVVTLALPSLAERREDIPVLAQQFLQEISHKYQKKFNGFASDAMSALIAAPWPGNVRQLYNVVEQVCALATSPLIPLALIHRALRVPNLDVLTYAEAKVRFERNFLVQLLKLTDGNVADAARLADRNRTEFYRLLQKYQLTPSLFRNENLASPDSDHQ